jgi:hypothetical protein
VFGPFILVSLAVGFSSHAKGTYVAGFLGGAFLIAALLLRADPPAYIANWGQGDVGEDQSAKVLSELKAEGWCVVDDVQRDGRGNWDHVLVGPPGVFLIESKNLTGIVRIERGEPWWRGKHDPESDRPLRDIKPRVLAAAADLHERLERATGHSLWVNAVVVFWNPVEAGSDLERGVVETPSVAYAHGSKIVDWLRAQPAKLDPASQRDFAASISGVA